MAGEDKNSCEKRFKAQNPDQITSMRSKRLVSVIVMC